MTSSYVKIEQFTKDQIIDAMQWHLSRKLEYNLEYSKINLMEYIDQAYAKKLKSKLKVDMRTGTVSDRYEWLEKFSNVNDWKNLDKEDQDPLYMLAHNVKCEAVRLYNCIKYNL